ncbi:MAG: T9SS type A sorting domain-containing protein [Flavobacteriales bacterium]|nr:T9SS type A sorting domain-containing protein [Flavobacteriales bacterium]
MNRIFSLLITSTLIAVTAKAQPTLVYHDIVTDNNGNLIPWYNADHGTSYDHCLDLVWNFWKNIPTCCGGHKYYMIDHSYNEPVSGNMVGGDQFAMILSSWALYYAYTGDTALVQDMVYIADTYLANSLSPSNCEWPDLPYGANYGDQMAAVYDGDFLIGQNYTQPDKAGSFGAELLNLYKITGNEDYLQACVKIANTLADKVQPGSSSVSPYPFRVNAITGDLPPLLPDPWHYTTNFIPTMRLFEDLSEMEMGNTAVYDSAYGIIKSWMQQYPVQNNEWGSFFEDIPVPSKTEINAVMAANYILQKGEEWAPTWQQDARNILDWVLDVLGSTAYQQWGTTAIYEQTADMKEAGSHTAHFASAELLYAEKTGDNSRVEQAIRQLDWATYMVDFDGKCKFSPQGASIWYTDGYGDFVRHFLRAMGSLPSISFPFDNHMLRSSSVISYMNYQPLEINYHTYDSASTEMFRLVARPDWVKADGVALTELSSLTGEGWTWTDYDDGGLLEVQHDNAHQMQIGGLTLGITYQAPTNQKLEIYPNPAKANVRVHLPSVASGSCQLAVFDAVGRMVKNEPLTHANTDVNLDVSNLPGGIYTVQFRNSSHTASSKLVIRR